MAAFLGDYLQYEIIVDEVLQQITRDNFREEIERAASAGLEIPQAWYLLATSTKEPEERFQTLLRVRESWRSN